MTAQAHSAFLQIQPQLKVAPKIGIILGSGLGNMADDLDNATSFQYGDLPGFPNSQVQGHGGKLMIGTLHNIPIAMLCGRMHFYQDPNGAPIMKTMIRTLKLLGCETLIVTNAAGSLREQVGPGSIVAITDHINLQFHNPLTGDNDDDFGPRFIGLENLYNSSLLHILQETAKTLAIPLHQGVYCGVLGPTFETPAEIRAYRLLGADLVGMSTIADVIIAHHCGMKVVALSGVTNLAAGMQAQTLSHDITLQGATLVSKHMSQLLLNFITKI